MIKSIVPRENTDLNLKRDVLYLIFHNQKTIDCIKERCSFHLIRELKELKNQE